MDRRSKFILFLIGAAILFGLVVWLIVLPTLAPLFPSQTVAQPPTLPTTATPAPVTPGTSPSTGVTPNGEPTAPGGVATFNPGATANPDAEQIASLSARAGIMAERVESGSSENGFTNYDDASIDASPSLASHFRTLKTDMQKKYPVDGPTYFTIARRLVETPEETITGPTFKVTVQLQIQVRNGDTTSTTYLESTVTFTRSGDEWLASSYTTKAFTP